MRKIKKEHYGLLPRMGFIVLSLLILRVIIQQIHHSNTERRNSDLPSSTQKVWLEKDQDSVLVYRHGRNWRDNYGQSYRTNLTVRYQDVLDAVDSHKVMNPQGLENFWGELYSQMAKENSPRLDLIFDAFYQIYQQNTMSPYAFAEMVVTCIQNIPYALVFQDPCQEAEAYDGWMRELLSECPDCCIGEQAFGLQTPLGFMQNLKGDCDTRTVFLFSVLSAFNYDVAILNSDVYRHSVLGLNLPTSGQYKLFRGKKYRVWETTAPNHTLGSLPPQIGNMNFWNVVLTGVPEF